MPVPKSRVDLDTLRHMADDGESQKAAARRFCVTRQRIHQVCRKHGIKMVDARPIPPGQVEALMTRARCGMTLRDIAFETGMSQSTIWRLGVLRGHVWPDRRRSDPERVRRILELANKGLTAPEIARATGEHQNTVHHFAARNGISVARARKPRVPAPREVVARLAAEGLGPTAIADRIGCTQAGVSAAARRHGIAFTGTRQYKEATDAKTK